MTTMAVPQQDRLNHPLPALVYHQFVLNAETALFKNMKNVTMETLRALMVVQ